MSVRAHGRTTKFNAESHAGKCGVIISMKLTIYRRECVSRIGLFQRIDMLAIPFFTSRLLVLRTIHSFYMTGTIGPERRDLGKLQYVISSEILHVHEHTQGLRTLSWGLHESTLEFVCVCVFLCACLCVCKNSARPEVLPRPHAVKGDQRERPSLPAVCRNH